jgi:DUF4097 and DUF4098 domain-containing protein YvlB
MDSRRATVLAALAAAELVVLGLIFSSLRGLTHHGSIAFAATSSGTPADVHTTIATSHDPNVLLRDDDAHFHISTASAGNVRVDETTTTDGHVSGITPLSVERRTGNAIYIGRHERYSGTMHRDIAVVVPFDATVEVDDCTSLTMNGLSGSATIHCTGDEPVEITNQHGDLLVKNDDGRVSITHMNAGRLEVDNSDGRVELSDVHADFLTVKTDDGHIEGAGIVAANGSVQSEDGNVALRFGPAANVTVAVKTGATVTAVPPLQIVQIGDSESERQIRFGAGDGRLDIKTDDGSVSLAAAGV